MKPILRIQKKILDFLLEKHIADSSFRFVPRKINNKNRLNEGYWFIGNDDYMQLSFWNGGDWKEKIHNIGFSIGSDKNCYIDFSAQDSEAKATFFHGLTKKITGFKKDGGKNRWRKKIGEKDYINNLTYFINTIKPMIDSEIKLHKPRGIKLLDKTSDKYIAKVLQKRNAQIKNGETNKVCRLVWNTNNWKSPSGLSGCPATDYKSTHGFGHEEWLFDLSRIIDGYIYSFLEPLRLITNDHVGKVYNISLYTSDYAERKYYVGEIKNVECISKEDSTRIHKIYKANGWFDNMINDLKQVAANFEVFKSEKAEKFVNIRFKTKDIQLADELTLISEYDLNITAPRYKLLPKVSNISFETEEDINDDETGNDSGKLKSTKKRKRIVHSESEFDPYHDKMQNNIFHILRTLPEYDSKSVKIEKGRVDLKAKTHKAKWHFFEIKTDSPKLSIRKALGQILEYAYYPEYRKAEKLIIVSDTPPSENDIVYMKHIRMITNLPIYYKYYSFEKNTVSEDY